MSFYHYVVFLSFCLYVFLSLLGFSFFLFVCLSFIAWSFFLCLCLSFITLSLCISNKTVSVCPYIITLFISLSSLFVFLFLINRFYCFSASYAARTGATSRCSTSTPASSSPPTTATRAKSPTSR